MKLSTFKRGIHIHDGKEHTSSCAIQKINPKTGQVLMFPMSQHLGAPCEPLVAKGDTVLLGQKIGDSEAFVCAPIHSSVSGVVTDIKEIITPTGITSKAVFIENDGLDTPAEDLHDFKDYAKIPKDQLLKIIKEAGIVGLGGAGFPTHIKLNPPADKVIDYIIINAAECEPYLTTDHRVMLEETPRLVRGLQVMLSLHPKAKGIIGIETNKPDCIAKLQEATKDISNIEIVGLKPKYPQGAEKQLIYACTGREVPSGGLPADIGCIVNNVDTCIAIERAAYRARPLIRKVVTLVGSCLKNPGNYKVRLGQSLSDILDEIGGFKSQPTKIISGGPMMGVAAFSTDIPICKTSAAFIFLTDKEAHIPPERNCIRCGKCVRYCPIGLLPFELNQAALASDLDLFGKCNGGDCIECGCCSYVCPSKRHLAQSIRAYRRELLARRKK